MLSGHRVQFGFGYVVGHNSIFMWLPVYWVQQFMNVCDICASKTTGVFHKQFEIVVKSVIGKPSF